MLCPKENCIHDSFPRTGEHVCAYGSCKYNAARELAHEAFLITSKDKLTHKDKIRLQGLKAAYLRALESG